jgi:hypothetical protein
MFNSQLKTTGRDYSLTIALLATAVVFIPALLLASRPFGSVSLAIAAAGSVLCLVLARVTWMRLSKLTIPTME